MLPSVR